MPVGTAAFDVVGTLFSLDAPRNVLAQNGAPPMTFDVWFAGALRDYFARSHSGAYTPLKELLETTLGRAARIVGWNLDQELTRKVMDSLRQLAPAEGAKEALEQLRVAGWKTVAVTNSSRDLANELLARAGLEQQFDDVISCDDIRHSKPHPAVYEQVKRHSQGDTWLIAAHSWDVAGAITAGLRGVWLSASEHIYPDCLPTPHLTADKLTSAVEAVLQTHSGSNQREVDV